MGVLVEYRQQVSYVRYDISFREVKVPSMNNIALSGATFDVI